jgi:hypothetical protein
MWGFDGPDHLLAQRAVTLAQSGRGQQGGADEATRAADRFGQRQALSQARGDRAGQGAAGTVGAGGFDALLFPASCFACAVEQAVEDDRSFGMAALDEDGGGCGQYCLKAAERFELGQVGGHERR